MRQFVKDKDIGMDADEMGRKFIDSMEGAFENWTPREKYTLEVV